MGADVDNQDRDPERARPTVLRVTSRRDESLGIVSLGGELDMDGADQVVTEVRALLGAGVERLRIDGVALDFVDSAGLRTLLALQAEVSAAGVAFEVAASPHLTRLLELTGLTDILSLIG